MDTTITTTPITKEQFLIDANKCFNSLRIARDLTPEEQEFAWDLLQKEVLIPYPDFTYEMLHGKVEAKITNEIVMRSRSWFSYILSSTYKKYCLS